MLINEIADGMDMSLRQRDEFSRLAYEYPLELVDMLLTGQIEEYLKAFVRGQQSQEDIISAQLRERGYSQTQANALAREFMRYAANP